MGLLWTVLNLWTMGTIGTTLNSAEFVDTGDNGTIVDSAEFVDKGDNWHYFEQC